MNDLMKLLEEQEKDWLKKTALASAFLKNAPKGRVKTMTCHGKYPQYYYSEQDDAPPVKYAGVKKKQLVQKLAQKEFFQSVVNYLDPALKKLQSFMKWYDPEGLSRLYTDLPEGRKRLVEPVDLTDEDYLCRWYGKHLPGDPGYPIIDEIMSNKGEALRSKSEKIIADKLYELNIPYVYESPLSLPGTGTVYPDFTVLNVRLRKTFYFEHFGLMDDPTYSTKAFKKISSYSEAGLWFGNGLLYTFESDHSMLNTTMLEKMIPEYLL